MKKIYKKVFYTFLVTTLIIFTSITVKSLYNKHLDEKNGIGKVIDSYKEVQVYYNGSDYSKNHGKNYSEDGYYYGYKWQCVEFIKRFYYLAKNHRMPDVYGNAKDFFDNTVEHGKLNKSRGLIQYKNGENERPVADDILVFNDTTYGHIVIVTEVGTDFVEVIQQNMGKTSRSKFELKFSNGKYYIGGKRTPVGFLRKE